MAITFAVRGDSLNARYSSAGKDPGFYTTSAIANPSVDANANAIGGYVLNCDAGSAVPKALAYAGRSNFPSTDSFSMLFRVAWPADADTGFFSAGNLPISSIGGKINISYAVATHVVTCAFTNEYGANKYTSAFAATFTPTAGVFYDIVFTYNGVGTTNALKWYVNGVLQNQVTIAAVYNSGAVSRRPNNLIMFLGTSSVGPASRLLINEFVLWDTVIDATQNQTLESGAGMLNGATRNSYVAVAAFDGTYSTNPAIGNVNLNVGYYVNGVAYTGTLICPAASDTRYGVQVLGSTGTCYVPTAANTRYGVNVDNTTGLAYIPTAANTRYGTNVDQTTGLIHVPAVTDVVKDVAVDQTVGTYKTTVAADVRAGTLFGPSSSLTGTMIASVDVWSNLMENGLTYAEAVRLMFAVLTGKTTINGTTVTFRDNADTKARLTASMTGSTRTSVTLDGA